MKRVKFLWSISQSGIKWDLLNNYCSTAILVGAIQFPNFFKLLILDPCPGTVFNVIQRIKRKNEQYGSRNYSNRYNWDITKFKNMFDFEFKLQYVLVDKREKGS